MVSECIYEARMVSGLEMEIMVLPLILILPAALDLEQPGIFQDSVTLHLSDTKRWRASKASRPMMRTTLLATNAIEIDLMPHRALLM